MDAIIEKAEDWTSILHRVFNAPLIIALTDRFEPGKLSGYDFETVLPKNCSNEAFCAAVDSVIAANNDKISDLPASKISKKDQACFLNETRFTKREQEILGLIMENLTSKEISQKLFLSERTVETHRYNLLKKIKLANLQPDQSKDGPSLHELKQKLPSK